VANPKIVQVADAPKLASCYTSKSVFAFLVSNKLEGLLANTRRELMSRPSVRMVILFTMIALVSACGPVATDVPPTATTVPPLPTTAPPAAIPTDFPPTEVPPTATPAPTMTPTVSPPTATPAPTKSPISWERLATLAIPDSFVNTILFSPDSQTMITGDRNGEVLLWKRETWEKITFLPARSTYTEDEAAGTWYWGTLALSPDGGMIVNAYGDDGTVTGYDLTGQVMFTYPFGSRVWAVAISPDGRLLAMAGLPNNVVVLDLETYQQVANLVSDYEYIFNLVFSPAGDSLLVGYERPANMIKLWDTATWQETSTFTHVSERIDYHDILFTPDGTELILATNELGDPIGVRVWDLAGNQIVRELPQNSQAAYQIALSPDGSLLASVHEALQVWDMETGASVKTIRVPNRELGAVAFSPDGTLIAFSVWGEGVQVRSIPPATTNASPTPVPPAAINTR
jgi:WD40 repeat protein